MKKHTFWKRTAAGILALCLAGGSVPMNNLPTIFEMPPLVASAENPEEDGVTKGEWCDGIQYSFNENTGVLTLSPAPDATVSRVDSLTTAIPEFLSKISQIVISEGITEIGNNAFGDWREYLDSSPVTVVISGSVTEIGDNAFQNLTAGALHIVMKPSPDNLTLSPDTFADINLYGDVGTFAAPNLKNWTGYFDGNYDSDTGIITLSNESKFILKELVTPTAAEDLEYSGQEQKLVDADSVPVGAPIQYLCSDEEPEIDGDKIDHTANDFCATHLADLANLASSSEPDKSDLYMSAKEVINHYRGCLLAMDEGDISEFNLRYRSMGARCSELVIWADDIDPDGLDAFADKAPIKFIIDNILGKTQDDIKAAFLKDDGWTDEIPTGTDKKTYTIYYRIDPTIPDSARYTVEGGYGTLTAKIGGTETVTPTAAEDLQYNGKEQKLVDADSVPEGAPMQYRLTKPEMDAGLAEAEMTKSADYENNMLKLSRTAVDETEKNLYESANTVLSKYGSVLYYLGQAQEENAASDYDNMTNIDIRYFMFHYESAQNELEPAKFKELKNREEIQYILKTIMPKESLDEIKMSLSSDAEWADEIPAEASVGDYTVYYRVKPDAENAGDFAVTGTVGVLTATIDPGEVELKPAEDLKYDGKEHELVDAATVPDGLTMQYCREIWIDGNRVSEDYRKVGGANGYYEEMFYFVETYSGDTDSFVRTASDLLAKYSEFLLAFTEIGGSNAKSYCSKMFYHIQEMTTLEQNIGNLPTDITDTEAYQCCCDLRDFIWDDAYMELDFSEGSTDEKAAKVVEKTIEMFRTKYMSEIGWTDAIPAGTKAGNYTVYYRVNPNAEEAANYRIGKLTATIDPGEVTLKAAEDLQYDGEEHGLVDADSVPDGARMLYCLTPEADINKVGAECNKIGRFHDALGGLLDTLSDSPKDYCSEAYDLMGDYALALASITNADSISAAKTNCASAFGHIQKMKALEQEIGTLPDEITDTEAYRYYCGICDILWDDAYMEMDFSESSTDANAQAVVDLAVEKLCVLNSSDENWQIAIPTGTVAGDYTVYYRANPEDRNFTVKGTVGALTATIDPAEVTLKAAKDLRYNGKEQYLVDPKSEPEDVNILYYLNPKSDISSISDADEGWTNKIPTGTDAGGYDIYYRVDPNDDNTGNYTIPGKIAKLTATIADATIVTLTAAEDLTYDGKQHELVDKDSVPAGVKMQYRTEEPELDKENAWEDAIPTEANAGEYTIYYRVDPEDKDSEKFTVGAAGYGTLTATIDPAEVTLTAAKDLIYNRTKQILVDTSGLPEGAKLEYAVVAEKASSSDAQEEPAAAEKASSSDAQEIAPVKNSSLKIMSSSSALKSIRGEEEDKKSSTLHTVSAELTWSSELPAATDAGTYTVYYRIDPEDENAGNFTVGESDYASVTATIDPETLTITAKKNMIFNGEEQTLVDTSGLQDGVEMEFAMVAEKASSSDTQATAKAESAAQEEPAAVEKASSSAAQAIAPADSVSLKTTSYFGNPAAGDSSAALAWSSEVPTAADAGTYTVYYRIKPDSENAGNYTIGEQEEMSLTATIGVADITPTIDIDGWTFSETSNAPTVTGNIGKGAETIEYKVKGADDSTYSTKVPATAGDYTVRVSIAATSNTNASTATKDFTIARKTASVTAPTANELTYTGKAQELVTAGTAEEGTMQYSLDGKNYTDTIPNAADAKTYTVYYKVTGAVNYTDDNGGKINVTIAKASLNPAVSINGWTYGEKANVPSVTGNTGKGNVTYTYYQGKKALEKAPTDAGTYTVKATIAETANYKAAEASAEFTIAKADTEITPSYAENLVYTGDAQELFAAALTGGGTLLYSLDGEHYSVNKPEGTNAGAYTVWYKVEGDKNHNDVAAESTDVTISPAPVKLTAADALTYNAKKQKLVTGEIPDFVQFSLTKPSKSTKWSDSVPTGTKPGSYVVYYRINPDSEAAGNYTIGNDSSGNALAYGTLTTAIALTPADFELVTRLPADFDMTGNLDADTVWTSLESIANGEDGNMMWRWLESLPKHGIAHFIFARNVSGDEESGETVTYSVLTITGKDGVLQRSDVQELTIDDIRNGMENEECYEVYGSALLDLRESCDLYYIGEDGEEHAVTDEQWQAEYGSYGLGNIFSYNGEEHELTFILRDKETEEELTLGKEFVFFTEDQAGEGDSREHFRNQAKDVDWYWTGIQAPATVEGKPNPYCGYISVSWNIEMGELDTSNLSAVQKERWIYQDGNAFEFTAEDFNITDPDGVLSSGEAVYDFHGEEGVMYTDAGSYEITLTISDIPGYLIADVPVTITIDKADPKPDAVDGLTANYGDTLGTVELPAGWAWDDTARNVGNTGKKSFTATYTPEDTDNYNTLQKKLSVTVAPVPAQPEKVEMLNATFGDALADVTLPMADGGTWTWTDAEDTSVGDAGKQKFTAIFTPDSKNYTSVTQEITVRVAKAAITPEVTMDGWTYGGKANTPTVTGNTGNGAVTYTYYEGEKALEKAPTSVGTYTVKASVAETANYKAGTASTTFSIVSAEFPVTTRSFTGTYDGKAHGISASAKVEGAKVYFSSEKLDEAGFIKANQTASPTFTDAGEYTVYYCITAPNYKTVIGSETVKISKREVTITANSVECAFGADIPELTYSVTGNIISGDDLGIQLSTKADKNSAGKYEIFVNYQPNANYTVTTVNGNVTVKEAAPIAEETKPVAEETTPAAEETKPAAEETTPAAEETKPAAEETTPAAEETTMPTEVKPQGWYASLAGFARMSKNDYEQKHDYDRVYATVKQTGEFEVVVELRKPGHKLMDVYTFDARTGIGTNQDGEEVNLPQTGVTTRSPIAAAAAAIATALSGLWLTIRASRKKEDEE